MTNVTDYRRGRGYGWLNGALSAIDRKAPDDLRRDLIVTPSVTFTADVADGDYLVTVILGDHFAAKDQVRITMEDVVLGPLDTEAGKYVKRTRPVTVSDGQLSVQVETLGGKSFNAPINVLDVFPVDFGEMHFDFGTAHSPVGTGYTQVSDSAMYDSAVGFGWLSGSVVGYDQSGPNDVQHDLNQMTSGTFATNLTNGSYDVTGMSGDQAETRKSVQVTMGKLVLGPVTTESGEFVQLSALGVLVSDRQLIMIVESVAGGNNKAAINGLVVTAAAASEFYFDFGTSKSPVAANYERVAAAMAYQAAGGCGWLEGTIKGQWRSSSPDGGELPDALKQDLNQTSSGVFAADAPNGDYLVTITLGDLFEDKDQMRVTIEDVVLGPLDTAAGEFVQLNTRVRIADSQLTLRLESLAGGNSLAAINALELSPVEVSRFHYDFGTSRTAVQAEYTQVTESTTYTSGQGYGWLAGAVLSRDLGATGNLHRDVNQTYSGQFAVDPAEGIT